jgi:sulfonate transport system substrate-binding protein
VHDPISDEVINAQQDAANLALRDRIIPKPADVRATVVKIQ